MPTQELSGTTALVTGASRGFGRAIAIALSEQGAHVVGVARDRAPLEELRAQLGGTFTPVAADATDPVVAGLLLDQHRPRTLVLNAGAAPLTRPIHRHTWQTFSRNWDVDVQHVFNWTREALLLPLEPGSVVIAMSSGAAVAGSPVSGGYAGAKATIRFIASYAAAESGRNALGIRFASVLPQLTPETGLGAAAVAAYAARQGVDVPAFLADRGPALTPEQVGTAITGIVTGSGSGSGSGDDRDAYLLTAAGLSPAP
jgi:NADP-dependent 3-hydroxy acid dehydrogenase YdfG